MTMLDSWHLHESRERDARASVRAPGGNLDRFSPEDFAALQSAALALHSHRDLPTLREAAPGILLGLVPADYFHLTDVLIDPARKRVRLLDVWASAPYPMPLDLERTETLLFEHPFVQHLLAHGSMPQAMRLTDFIPPGRLRRTRLYRELLVPSGVRQILGVGTHSAHGIAVLSLERVNERPVFSARDRRMLELVRGHLDLARTNLERETQVRAMRTTSLRAFGLTPRETEVALWLMQGKTNPEIGMILDCPMRTVEKHVEHVLHKLGAANRVAAAVTIQEVVRA